MNSIAVFVCVLLSIFDSQVLGLKQHSIQSHAASIPQYIPPQRFCGCDELDQCVNDQLAKEKHLLVNCREQCGSRIFLHSTLNKVVGCYDAFGNKRSEADLHRRRCIESLGSKQCVSHDQINAPPTFTINTTEYLQAGSKRDCNGNRKLSLPESINSLNTCIRTCVKNLGVVQFNPDGTIVKPSTKSAKNKEINEEQQQQKNGKENGANGAKFTLCATLLNCQLSPTDKKLDKQAKSLCKFQPGPQEDNVLTFCTCLENALGQNLYCAEQLSPNGSCPSTNTQCTDARKNGEGAR